MKSVAKVDPEIGLNRLMDQLALVEVLYYFIILSDLLHGYQQRLLVPFTILERHHGYLLSIHHLLSVSQYHRLLSEHPHSYLYLATQLLKNF